DPITTADIPAAVLIWLQVVGGFAALANGMWLPFGYLRQREEERRRIPAWMRLFFVVTGTLGLACYAVALIFGLASLGRDSGDPVGRTAVTIYVLALSASGVLFILEAGVPFLLGVFKMRFGRIYALAKLSFKEALRRRILYAFS